LERQRGAFLQAAFGMGAKPEWRADTDAYSYCWLDFGRSGPRWCLAEIGTGSVNE
jgi:hypothetical protein